MQASQISCAGAYRQYGTKQDCRIAPYFIGRNRRIVERKPSSLRFFGHFCTPKCATYSLVGRLIDRMRRHFDRSQDINEYTEELSVEIDHYEEKDYTNVDNTIERLGLKPRDRVVLDCYMAGMTCNEIAEFLDISRIAVWRRRTRAQVKYKTLFN